MIERRHLLIHTDQRISPGKGGPKAFHSATHHHAPGSVIRGAVAAAWISENTPRTGDFVPDETFLRIFEQELRFGPGYADGSSPTPQSLRTVKYPAPGVPAADLVDLAFDEVAPIGSQSSTGAVSFDPDAPEPICVTTSTQIDHQTRSAAKGQLFSRDALRSGLHLTASVSGPADVLDLLQRFVGDTRRVVLGGRGSVLGSSTISMSVSDEVWPPAIAAGPLVLRLTSPALLVDDTGRPTPDLSAWMRARLTSSTVQVWQRSLTDGLGGWHTATGTPKPAEIGVAAGGTARIQASAADLAEITAWLRDGIGVRRNEGFGWLAAVDKPVRPGSAAHPAEQGEPTAAPEENDFDTVNRLRPDTAQRRWIAGQLRDLAAAAVQDRANMMTAAMSQRQFRGLRPEQQHGVRELLQALAKRPAAASRLADRLLFDDAPTTPRGPTTTPEGRR